MFIYLFIKELVINFILWFWICFIDFPEVNWVLQLDCPEDANTYIHRVGRTARYANSSLLIYLFIKQCIKYIFSNCYTVVVHMWYMSCVGY